MEKHSLSLSLWLFFDHVELRNSSDDHCYLYFLLFYLEKKNLRPNNNQSKIFV